MLVSSLIMIRDYFLNNELFSLIFGQGFISAQICIGFKLDLN